MFIDCDSHFDPPEVFDDPEVKRYKGSHVLHMNGWKYSAESLKKWHKNNGLGTDDRYPYVTDLYGHVMSYELTNLDVSLRERALKEGSFDKQCIIGLYNRLSVPPKAEAAYSKARNYHLSKYAEKYDWFI